MALGLTVKAICKPSPGDFKKYNSAALGFPIFFPSTPPFSFFSLLSVPFNIGWVPGTVLGDAGKMMPGADVFFCLHRAPVSGGRQMGRQEITTWYSTFPERARGTPRPLVLGRLPDWGKGRRLQASFLFSCLLPSPFLPSFLPVFSDYLEYLSELKLCLQ